MSGASKVMYTIANVFTWIVVLLAATGIVLFPLMMVGIIENNTGYNNAQLIGMIVYLSLVILFSLVAISMVRIAKRNGSSKGWDLLFVILGALSGNPFYILGGIFGLLAAK